MRALPRSSPATFFSSLSASIPPPQCRRRNHRPVCWGGRCCPVSYLPRRCLILRSSLRHISQKFACCLQHPNSLFDLYSALTTLIPVLQLPVHCPFDVPNSVLRAALAHTATSKGHSLRFPPRPLLLAPHPNPPPPAHQKYNYCGKLPRIFTPKVRAQPPTCVSAHTRRSPQTLSAITALSFTSREITQTLGVTTAAYVPVISRANQPFFSPLTLMVQIQRLRLE
jgi:hypothetical protein